MNNEACFIPEPVIFPQLRWFAPDRWDAHTNVASVASGDGRRVFALLFSSPLRVVEISPDGTQTPFFEMSGRYGIAMSVARDGRIYVSMSSGPAYSLGVISPAGVLLAEYPANIRETMAAGPDGCTVFYTSGAYVSLTVHRINGCTGAVLPDFATVPDNIRDVFPLANGQVLIATGNQGPALQRRRNIRPHCGQSLVVRL